MPSVSCDSSHGVKMGLNSDILNSRTFERIFEPRCWFSDSETNVCYGPTCVKLSWTELKNRNLIGKNKNAKYLLGFFVCCENKIEHLGILVVGWKQRDFKGNISLFPDIWQVLVQRENNLIIKWNEWRMLWLIKQDNMRTRSTQSDEKLVSHPAAPDFRRWSGDKMLELQAFSKEEEQSGFCFHSYPLNLESGSYKDFSCTPSFLPCKPPAL